MKTKVKEKKTLSDAFELATSKGIAKAIAKAIAEAETTPQEIWEKWGELCEELEEKVNKMKDIYPDDLSDEIETWKCFFDASLFLNEIDTTIIELNALSIKAREYYNY